MAPHGAMGDDEIDGMIDGEATAHAPHPSGPAARKKKYLPKKDAKVYSPLRLLFPSSPPRSRPTSPDNIDKMSPKFSPPILPPLSLHTHTQKNEHGSPNTAGKSKRTRRAPKNLDMVENEETEEEDHGQAEAGSDDDVRHEEISSLRPLLLVSPPSLSCCSHIPCIIFACIQ